MEVSRIRALRGPNLWSRNTAIEAIVTCSENERSLDAIPGFEERLRERFPEIGFLNATGHYKAVPLARVLEFSVLGLQAQAGCPVTFSRTSETINSGTYQVVVEYSEEDVGRLAFDLAEQLIKAALENKPFDRASALSRLKKLDENVRLGPSTGSIVEAAVSRGIPYRRLTQGSLVQFGWGSKQRRIQAAETDRSNAIAESIAQDKELTKQLLHATGVPVPLGRPVTSAGDAWSATQEIGGPVVVKPRYGNQGKGISVNIQTREEITAAYNTAIEFCDEVLVERYLPGHDYRFLVIGNKDPLR
jgi:cyanophycin synthetase